MPARNIWRPAARLARLAEQRADLAAASTRCSRTAWRARALQGVRQFKMYNDPAFNPYLYGAKR